MKRILTLLFFLCISLTVTVSAEPAMDGNFGDWQSAPVSKAEDPGGGRPSIRQARWQMSEDMQTLYLMAELALAQEETQGKLYTDFETEFGSFSIETSFDATDGTAMSRMDGQVVEETGACKRVGASSLFLEFSVPLGQKLTDPRWEYHLRFRLRTDMDELPSGSWISLTTNGLVAGGSGRTPEMVWVLLGLAGAIIAAAALFRKRRKNS